ncbi:MAG: TRAM domain-containing protein [Ardenticatenales bacterium]|nr:TRAM domain-containing protein [Ardenticatenales bacterium]
MSFEFFLRLLGMVALAAAGWRLGENLAGGNINDSEVMRGILSLSLAGAALGLLLTPYLTTRPLEWIRRRVRQLPANIILGATAGLVLGLIVAALLTPPLSRLPGILGQVLPFAGALFFGYAGVQIMVLRERDLLSLLQARLSHARGQARRYVLLDTSVIIDGRIADIAQTGFVEGTMLVPRFVLGELQHIAGSKDPLRRNRGKRGLDILNQLQKDSTTPLEISDVDVPEIQEVDAKLVAIARDMQASVLTTDYNLNKVAELQGVKVLNINELANAVKTLLLPGEDFEVEIIQEGREAGQGVGYLEDGTMVVVESGQKLMGQKCRVEVTRILQTVAGRMIFAQVSRPANGRQP